MLVLSAAATVLVDYDTRFRFQQRLFGLLFPAKCIRIREKLIDSCETIRSPTHTHTYICMYIIHLRAQMIVVEAPEIKTKIKRFLLVVIALMLDARVRTQYGADAASGHTQ